MNRTSIPLVVVLTAMSGGNVLSENQEITTEDGREIMLNDDGTWSFSSTDRFANTKDGRRVRLKDDGSWSYTGNAPVVSKEQVRTSDFNIQLKKVVIETYEKKVQKNKRVKTQTVFYLSLGLSALAKATISISKDDISSIEIKDNNGKSYPVISIQPSQAEVKPGSKAGIVVRVKGSPGIWDKVKAMSVTFKPGIFAIQEPITLSQNVDEFGDKNVGGFE